VTAILSVAVFILSFVGVWELFFHLWDYGSEKRNYPQNNPHNTENDTQIEQEKPKTQINKDSECITENHQAHTNKEKPIMVSESINFLAIF
jgi:hypothetical protein